MWGDIQSSRLLYLKGGLFVLLGGLSAGLLIAEHPSARTILLLALCVWSFCRAYYFAFYVVQHYAAPAYRFAGLWDFAKYCLNLKKRGAVCQDWQSASDIQRTPATSQEK